MQKTSTRKKPTPGHKFKGAQIGAVARCECGWSSATYFGQGCRSASIAEWHDHVRRCTAERPAA